MGESCHEDFHNTTRREFLLASAATGAAASLATVLPSHVLGREERVPPSETMTLGVIGIGPRCTCDLKAMLGFSDVRCLVIAEVQAKRRDAGKAGGEGRV